MRNVSRRVSSPLFVPFFAAAAFLACSTTAGQTSSGGPNADTDGGSASGGDAGDPKVSACRGRSFAAVEDWSIPMPAGSTSWQQGYERYTLLDIHGDGKPDLVITGSEKDKTLGDTKWLVFKNNGSSFEATPETWSLPMPAAGTSWQQGYERYTLLDIHGDGKPDLVITGSEKDKTLGNTKWLVFKNNGSSFETTPETWSLPVPAAGTSWQQGYERYTLVDVHGDGKPDLVITGSEKDKALGDTKWNVYKNNGSSFEKTPEAWSLPMPAAGTAWQTGSERYALVDIHGDGKPDLVITTSAADASLGETKWNVFKNTGSSFDKTAEAWSLPVRAPGTSWLMGSERYALVDIHGDGKPDLVITGTAQDTTIGEDHWDVYPNSGTSFDKSPEKWALAKPAASVGWFTGDTRYALIDIHGDKRPDLVFTGQPNDEAVGKTKWLVQTNKCE